MLYAAIERADLFATAIWSGKEAVLKALRKGLRLDVRCIACLFDATPPVQEWRPFQIDLDAQLSAQFPGLWSGWWRLHGQHVLTMAVFA
jgi:4'-phosphopantetheinyl transferase